MPSRAGRSHPRRTRTACLAAIGLTGLSLPVALAGEIVDQRGKRIVLDGPANRAVFLPMPAASSYIAIDGTERRIVGMNPSSAAAMREGILARIFPGISGIATNITQGAGTAPNVESILALQPDVVFQWATSGEEPLAMLERTGLNVVAIRYGDQGDMDGYNAIMGQVARKDARAAELIQRQTRRRAEIETTLKDLPKGERPRVLYVARFSDSLRVGGAGSYSDFVIRLAGGTNGAAELRSSGQVVTIEQVMTWNPGVILLGNFDTAQPEDVYNDPRWQGVAAVKARRVYRVPLGGYRWDPPSHESALTWTWLAGLLHPDRFKPELRADMRDWYKFLYGHELTEAETDRILFMSENSRSAGYARFRLP